MRVFRFLSVFLFAVLVVPSIAMVWWRIETVDSTGIVGDFSSLGLDSSDNQHISYSDFTNDDLKYAYFDGATWRIETVDSTGDVGGFTSLALDSSDNPHISYADWTNQGLKYAYFDGVTWRIETVDSTGNDSQSSVALDTNDNPHISYIGNGDLKYAYYDGASWQIDTVDSTGGAGWYTSLALDSSDNPHISYNVDTNDDQITDDLKYSYYDGANWRIETIDSTGNVGWQISIALDSSDTPHISYIGLANGDLKYAYKGLNSGDTGDGG